MKAANWQPYHTIKNEIPEPLREWLCYPGEFIERMKSFHVDSIHIDVLNQQFAMPHPDECEWLNLSEETLVREVNLFTESKKWMFARSLFPKSTLTGKESELANLNNRSLGSVIFHHPHMRRGEFKMAYLSSFNAWARRSLFYLQDKKILLTEVFLPDLLEFIHAT